LGGRRLALYKYEALDADGKKKKGTLEANNQEQANNSLRAEGLTVTNLAEAGMLDKEITLGGNKKPSARDMSVFCRQFVGILSAGVTVIKALDMLYEQMEQPTLKKALYNVRNSVQKGESLAVAMADEPDAFPSILCNMIAAGEASGNLEICFERMAVQFEKNARLKALVKKAMIYPVAIILVAIAVVIIMMVVVVPKFSVMFEGMGQELPLATRIVVAISNFMMNRWYVLIGIVAVLIVLGRHSQVVILESTS
jgi:type IV pilus assembly protein PilC